MYIEPTTNIKILRNVPIDNSYTNTIYFADRASQLNYFIGKVKYNLDKQSYQRYSKGVARVGITADNLYDCNYMMFQNPNFGAKWFYAFITNVEYINNETSEISYELDIMQTWFLDCDRTKPVMIDREHSATDNIGDSITEEPVALGEYVTSGYQSLGGLSGNLDYITAVATGDNAVVVDNIISGCNLTRFGADGIGFLVDLLQKYSEKPDAITAIYCVPSELVPHTQSASEPIPNGWESPTISVDLGVMGIGDFEGYTPHNKKLYTFPYNYLEVDDSNGTSKAYRFEFFKDNHPKFNLRGTILNPVKVVCYPVDYKGINIVNKQDTLTISSFPTCQWSSSYYSYWLAQNSVPYKYQLGGALLNSATSFGSTAMNTAIARDVYNNTNFANQRSMNNANVRMNASTLANIGGNAISLAGNIGNIALNYLSESYRASITADIVKGDVNIGSVNCAHKMNYFNRGRKHITKQYAMMIDNYFDKFGYSVKQLKVPNYSSRPHWNFIKTINASFTGNVPSNVLSKIGTIFDRGITFWKNGNEVNNYSLNNAI